MYEKWGVVALAAFGLVAVFLFNWNFQKNFDERVVRDQLLRSANHSSDAATEYMLWTSEETPTGLIIVDPEWVWYIYKFTFLESLGLYSEENIKELDHFFPSVIIAVNDGYFLHGTALNDNAEWEYRFGHKIPFARTPVLPTQTFGFVPDTVGINSPPAQVVAPIAVGDGAGLNPVIPASTDAFPVIISDTMNGKNLNVYYPNWNNDPLMVTHFGSATGRWVRYAVDGHPVDHVIGTAHDKTEIAKELLRGIDSLMRWNASPSSEYRQGGEVRIPTEIIRNFNSENVTFVGPMVIAIADNFTWLGNRAMSFWTLSNTQIVKSPRIYVYAVGWIHKITKVESNLATSPAPSDPNWIPKYLYSLCDPYGRDMFAQNMTSRPLVLAPDGTFIFQIFNSESSAAMFGAYPDVDMAQLCN